MSLTPVRNIVIVGGGTAGWMSAAMLAKMLGGAYSIRLVESDEIGIIGVGEATIPNIQNYNHTLGIDEDDFLRATQGSFKLGIEFADWGAVGERYIHGFGRIGVDRAGIAFHHYWLRLRRAGLAGPLDAYSINTAAPRAAKFMRGREDLPDSPLGDIAYAFHFDASLYARFLRRYAEARGVRRTEGKVVQVQQRESDGGIAAVVMEGGERIEGDFFIDCSGLRAMLIGQTLQVGFEDWSHWLPCDRAIAVPCAPVAPLLPLTRSTARAAGWQWRIPLQHRTGNGHVFCSHHMSEDEATALLLANLDGEPLAAPRTVRFTTGRRAQFWHRNCVAVGLSSGFLEPLESTSIHLIQASIARLVALFPHAGLDAEDIDEYNAQNAFAWERIRDLVIAHYHLTRRDDTAFWRQVREMSVPAALNRRVALFRSNGRVFRDNNELFAEPSWLQVLHGQGVLPRGYHPLADLPSEQELAAYVNGVRDVIQRCVAAMPTQAEFIAAHCAAPRP